MSHRLEFCTLESNTVRFLNTNIQSLSDVVNFIYLFSKFIYFYLFIFGCIGSSLLRMGFFQCGERGLLFVAVRRLLIAVASLVAEHGLQGFSSCGTWAQQLWLTGSGAQAQQLWCTGLVALWHVGSSRTRARTRIPCIGRRILNHCATREAQDVVNLKNSKSKTIFVPKAIYLFSFKYLT